MSKVRVHVKFKGYVQGVGFRYTAFHTANMYGLTGWVKNEWDGSVTAEAQGTMEEIQQWIAAVKSGTYIDVMDMTMATIPVEEDERTFEIKY
ncbi:MULTISPECIES: acylphosphatase [unclassified Butyrivibrio]|uniref:acylphosphatase n=1 Tax=unclassified Butyrivibrio TaxID=2639466 RepID=UPI00040FA475|nr:MULTISPECIES: acylphosphatase [unclassified Butyrivibrio]SDB69066.1 acylphosphatase [Butyrivibrio sp. INlla16]SEK71615.1 acylphosphatase [Butyrivibrio sp. ob235]